MTAHRLLSPEHLRHSTATCLPLYQLDAQPIEQDGSSESEGRTIAVKKNHERRRLSSIINCKSCSSL